MAGVPNGQSPPTGKLRPSNVGQACNTCRKRKCRCSGGKPVCSQCDTANLECIYTSRVDGRRAVTHEILAGLNQKIQQLEEENRQLKHLLGPTDGPVGNALPAVVPASTGLHQLFIPQPDVDSGITTPQLQSASQDSLSPHSAGYNDRRYNYGLVHVPDSQLPPYSLPTTPNGDVYHFPSEFSPLEWGRISEGQALHPYHGNDMYTLGDFSAEHAPTTGVLTDGPALNMDQTDGSPSFITPYLDAPKPPNFDFNQLRPDPSNPLVPPSDHHSLHAFSGRWQLPPKPFDSTTVWHRKSASQ